MSTLTRGDNPSPPSRPRHERRAKAPDLSFAPNQPRDRPAALDWPRWTDQSRWTVGPEGAGVMPLFDGMQGGGRPDMTALTNGAAHAPDPSDVDRHLAALRDGETTQGNRLKSSIWLAKHGIMVPVDDAPDVAEIRIVHDETDGAKASESPAPRDKLPSRRNLHAETALIAGMIRDNERIEALFEVAPPGDFHGDAQRAIAHAIAEVRAEGLPVDRVLLCERIEADPRGEGFGGRGVIEMALKLDPPPTPKQLARYAEIVRDHALERQAEIVGRQLSIAATIGGKEGARSIAAAAAKLQELQSRGLGAAAKVEDFAFQDWPAPRDDAHLIGVAGEIVRAVSPHTEADPMAILGQFLVMIGNAFGRVPCWLHESTRHGLNLFAVVGGSTATGLKGTSCDIAVRIMDGVDETWVPHLDGGLISGEGLIHSVRDAGVQADPKLVGLRLDPGVTDKRALFVETEFSTVLTVMGRRGSTLSEQLRKAWDGKPFGVRSRNDPFTATDHHVSVVAHITPEELDQKLPGVQCANGFGNRFIWMCSRQSQELPGGGSASRINWSRNGVQGKLREAVAWVNSEENRKTGIVLVRDKGARLLWDSVYRDLRNVGPGLLGAMKARGAPQVMRIAAIYAVLDCSSHITAEHLGAALTLWDYCSQSVGYLFGAAIGDPESERLFKAIEAAGEGGLSQNQITREVFSGRHADRAEKCLSRLLRADLVRRVAVATKGRPRTVYAATRHIRKCAESSERGKP